MRTPLYDEHVALGAHMVQFAGWDLPLLYRGIIPEHAHTRAEASVFDTCHMGEFEIRGPTAEADLERLLTQSVRAIRSGACAYGFLTADDGGVIDDAICFRFGPDRFWLVVNAGTRAADAEWIRSHVSPATVFNDRSSETAKLDVQGPRARERLEAALGIKLPDLGYFRFREMEIRGAPCVVSRTGYTGEFGYELFFPAEAARPWWRLLIEGGTIWPAGLGARDSLRIEMGYPLYGHELLRERSPVAFAGRRFIAVEKKFPGSEIIRRELERGTHRALVGLRLEGRMAARQGDAVLKAGAEVGAVTSGLFSPSLNTAVALAYVERACSLPGARVEVRARGKALPAAVAALPLYRRGTARQ